MRSNRKQAFSGCLTGLILLLGAAACTDGGDPLAFEPYSAEAEQEAAGRGQPVVIKFTASW